MGGAFRTRGTFAGASGKDVLGAEDILGAGGHFIWGTLSLGHSVIALWARRASYIGGVFCLGIFGV
jgi:hypothetical protein